MSGLFLDEHPVKTKVAAAKAHLSENADDWQSEIVNEAHKQNIFLGEYRARLIMNELDPEKRYALGAVEITNTTAVNPRDEGGKLNKALIPVVVKDGHLAPLDIFVSNGRAWPLTKDRLRMALFRPQMFEAARKGARDRSLVSTLMPPDRDEGGFSKGASVSSLIDRIGESVNMTDYTRFEDGLAAHVMDWPALQKHAGVVQFVAKLGGPPTQTGYDMMEKAAKAVRPTVIQVRKVGPSFMVKMANTAALDPKEVEVSRPEAVEAVGQDVVRTVENGKTVTVSTETVKKDTLYTAEISIIDQWGHYKVKTLDGRELSGVVFPRVLDLDGTQLPKAVFSNGSESAFQDEIAGSLVGKETHLIDETPQGQGVFYLARQGSAVALVPMEVKGEMFEPGNVKVYMCSTAMGEHVRLYPTSDIKAVAKISDGKYAIPDDMGFLPMRGSVQLVDNPEGFAKQASVNDLEHRLHLICDGTAYSFKGPAVKKLAAVKLPVDWAGHDEAMFNMVLLGHAPHEAREKLAQAKQYREVWTYGHAPTLLAERYSKAKTAAARRMVNFPKPLFLIKTAATVPDPAAVDHILSLGFLNPENVDIFLDAIPELENTLSKMCDLLFSARIGMSVDDQALERGVKHLENVIKDLKEMAHKTSA